MNERITYLKMRKCKEQWGITQQLKCHMMWKQALRKRLAAKIKKTCSHPYVHRNKEFFYILLRQCVEAPISILGRDRYDVTFKKMTDYVKLRCIQSCFILYFGNTSEQCSPRVSSIIDVSVIQILTFVQVVALIFLNKFH